MEATFLERSFDVTDWTPQQLDFYDALPASILLKAGPGTGKTTTLVEATHRLQDHGSTLALAFNKSIVETLSKKMPSSVTCKTMNGLGHKALMGYLSHKPTPSAYKTGEVMKALGMTFKTKEEWESVKDLVAAAKINGLVPKGSAGQFLSLVPDDDETWAAMADGRDIELFDSTVDFARQVLRESIRTAFASGEIDFDDQLYMPICWGALFPRFKNVLVDEAQDLSPIQHRMLKKVLVPNGNLIAVGDPGQAIYAFRGACHNSMDQLRETFSLEPMPLTVSFRCPKLVVEEAQQIYPDITAFEGNPDGVVDTISGEWTPEIGSVVLCRNNAPLISLAYKLLREGIAVNMAGRDIGKGFKALIKKLASGPVSMAELRARLGSWEKDEITNSKPWKKQKIADKAESLRILIDGSGCKTSEALVNYIDAFFAPKVGRVLLSTIHRAKGGEWETVYFLDENLIPSFYASGDDLIQEDNLRYVAITRSKKELFYVYSD